MTTDVSSEYVAIVFGDRAYMKGHSRSVRLRVGEYYRLTLLRSASSNDLYEEQAEAVEVHYAYESLKSARRHGVRHRNKNDLNGYSITIRRTTKVAT